MRLAAGRVFAVYDRPDRIEIHTDGRLRAKIVTPDRQFRLRLILGAVLLLTLVVRTRRRRR
jgi:hypothetical protein